MSDESERKDKGGRAALEARGQRVLLGLWLLLPAAVVLSAMLGCLVRRWSVSGLPVVVVLLLFVVVATLGACGLLVLAGATRSLERYARVLDRIAGLACLATALFLVVGALHGAGLAQGHSAPYAAGLLFAALPLAILLVAQAVSLLRHAGNPFARNLWGTLPGAVSLLFVPIVLVTFVAATATKRRLYAVSSECVNNVHGLASLIAGEAERRGKWPEADGPAFVLSVVGQGLVSPRNPHNLSVLFCPLCRPEGAWPPDPGPYRALTAEMLRHGNVGGLTSYAGRRNTDPRYRITPAREYEVVPIVACLCHADGVVIGWSDGRAGFIDRAELGLAPDDEITVGEASSVELLRGLSLE